MKSLSIARKEILLPRWPAMISFAYDSKKHRPQ
jgi:hypothetical protein